MLAVRIARSGTAAVPSRPMPRTALRSLLKTIGAHTIEDITLRALLWALQCPLVPVLHPCSGGLSPP